MQPKFDELSLKRKENKNTVTTTHLIFLREKQGNFLLKFTFKIHVVSLYSIFFAPTKKKSTNRNKDTKVMTKGIWRSLQKKKRSEKLMEKVWEYWRHNKSMTCNLRKIRSIISPFRAIFFSVLWDHVVLQQRVKSSSANDLSGISRISAEESKNVQLHKKKDPWSSLSICNMFVVCCRRLKKERRRRRGKRGRRSIRER